MNYNSEDFKLDFCLWEEQFLVSHQLQANSKPCCGGGYSSTTYLILLNTSFVSHQHCMVKKKKIYTFSQALSHFLESTIFLRNKLSQMPGSFLGFMFSPDYWCIIFSMTSFLSTSGLSMTCISIQHLRKQMLNGVMDAGTYHLESFS